VSNPTTAPVAESPSRDPIRSTLRILEVGGALTVLGYGYGWILLAETLRPLKVSPEEIGIGPSWLAVRAPLYLLPFILGALVALILTRVDQRLGRTAHVTSVFVASAVLFGLILWVMLYLLESPSTPGLYVLARTAGYVALAVLILIVPTWWKRRAGLISRIGPLALIAALIFNFLADVSYYNHVGSLMKQGKRAGVYTLNLVPVITTPLVSVSTYDVTSGKSRDLSPCALYMGASNGVSVVISLRGGGTTEVLRLPSDQVTLKEIDSRECFPIQNDNPDDYLQMTDEITWE